MRHSRSKPLSSTSLSSSSSTTSLLLITITLLSHPLPPTQCIAAAAAAGDRGRSIAGRQEQSEPPGWEILTKRNFSSQIRAHPRLLLMVTVPWSGESRSLMKEIAHLVAGKGEDLGYIKLMVVFRNSEKLLADALGASEGITLIYYHHATSYKYKGRLRAQNVLSSVYQFMLLQDEEVPLKPLHTQKDLESFLQSTDKSVLLLEFCGWSTELLHRSNHNDHETTQTMQSHSETVGLCQENLSGEASGEVAFEKIKNPKAFNSEELTCGTESWLADSPLPGGWAKVANQSDTVGSTYKNGDTEMLCTLENYLKFKSFFLEFMKISREYFLPLERHRFGLISERSLLPLLNVGNPETWLVVLQFSGCSNCLMIVHEGDDLRTILQTHHTLVKELDADGNPESGLPENRPSVILFIDRSSDSSKVRGESISALQILRKFVMDNFLTDQIVKEKVSSNPQSYSGKHFPNFEDELFQLSVKDSATSKLIRFQDNMAIMLTNEEKNIALDASAVQVNSLYNILADLLNKKKPSLEKKDIKISLLAKELGFQLLSDDFKVQIEDSTPSQNDDSKINYIHKNALASAEDQAFKLSVGSDDDSVVRDGILLDSDYIASVNEEKPPKHTNKETCLHQNQELTVSRGSITAKLTTILTKELEDEICTSGCEQANQNEIGEKEEGLKSQSCPAKDLEKGLSCVENSAREQNMEPTDWSPNKISSDLSKQDLVDVTPQKCLVESNVDNVIKSVRDSMSYDHNIQQLPFSGSFFFSDGGYQLLRSLTGEAKIPSLVILDPVLQHHYVFSDKRNINYSSLYNFVKEFLNGSLTPYQRAASPVNSSREYPRPPFVNLDFREDNSIPRVTANSFCELIMGYRPCRTEKSLLFSSPENLRSAWKMDVLVLFSTSWCGFCQRMELIVREVYRTFGNFKIMSKNSLQIQDKAEDTMTNGIPSIFLMDCTLNDCGAFLKPNSKKEIYPALLLFPAENKTAIPYEGDLSVVEIIEFLVSHGRNTHQLTRHRGSLWRHSWKKSKISATLNNEFSPTQGGASFMGSRYNEITPNMAARGDDQHHIGSHMSSNLQSAGHHVVGGSILVATDKLLDVVPFDNSTILIVTANKDQGFQGLIINKKLSWDVLKELDQQFESLKQAPLFYGGPVRAHSLPLVSLSRNSIEGYVKVTANSYFGNPLATRLAIEGIKSGDRSANDFWFFLGYSSWAWNQLFDELAAGAWYLSEFAIENLSWPDR